MATSAPARLHPNADAMRAAVAESTEPVCTTGISQIGNLLDVAKQMGGGTTAGKATGSNESDPCTTTDPGALAVESGEDDTSRQASASNELFERHQSVTSTEDARSLASVASLQGPQSLRVMQGRHSETITASRANDEEQIPGTEVLNSRVNEERQRSYLEQLSMRRKQKQEQEAVEQARRDRVRRKAREAVAARAEAHRAAAEQSSPRASDSQQAASPTNPRVSGTRREARREALTDYSTGDGSTSRSLSPAKRRPGPPKEVPRGYQKYTERLDEVMKAAHRRQPGERACYAALTREDRRMRQAQWREGFEKWKAHTGVPEEAKVFIMRGGYKFIRDALLSRGWYENEDPASDFFDFKWTLKTKHIYRHRLHDCQCVNHFGKSFACLTTKVGLLTALQDVHWHFPENSLAFHPRAYNLSQDSDFLAFEVDFKWTAAAGVLRMVLRDGGFHPRSIPSEEVAQLALQTVHARLAFQGDLVCMEVDDGKTAPLPTFTEAQWSLLLDAPAFQMATSMKYTRSRKSVRSGRHGSGRRSGRSNKQKSEVGGADDGADNNGDEDNDEGEEDDDDEDDEDGEDPDEEGDCDSEDEEQGTGGADDQEDGAASQADAAMAQLLLEAKAANHFNQVREHEVEPVSTALRAEIVQALAQLKTSVPQYDNVDGPDNIWILKPGGKSRGRGIHCFNNLRKLRMQVRADTCQDGQAQQLVAQKYIENPLVVKERKFDIRQWVLVTSWEPLTIWFYDECYIRFCAEDYKPENFDNIFCHLSNNSIAKKSSRFATDDATGLGNMWTSQQFANHLQESGGAPWSALQNRMKQIVLYSLVGAQDLIDQRSRSFELFGYDFLVDASGKVWLLEINCSPTFEHSTPVTAQLVRDLSEDIIRVTVDVPAHREAQRRTGTQLEKRARISLRPRSAAQDKPEAETSRCIGDLADEDLLFGRSGANATAAFNASLKDCETGKFRCIFRDVLRPLHGGLSPAILSAEGFMLVGQPVKLPSTNRVRGLRRTESDAATSDAPGGCGSLTAYADVAPRVTTFRSLPADSQSHARDFVELNRMAVKAHARAARHLTVSLTNQATISTEPGTLDGLEPQIDCTTSGTVPRSSCPAVAASSQAKIPSFATSADDLFTATLHERMLLAAAQLRGATEPDGSDGSGAPTVMKGTGRAPRVTSARSLPVSQAPDVARVASDDAIQRLLADVDSLAEAAPAAQPTAQGLAPASARVQQAGTSGASGHQPSATRRLRRLTSTTTLSDPATVPSAPARTLPAGMRIKSLQPTKVSLKVPAVSPALLSAHADAAQLAHDAAQAPVKSPSRQAMEANFVRLMSLRRRQPSPALSRDMRRIVSGHWLGMLNAPDRRGNVGRDLGHASKQVSKNAASFAQHGGSEAVQGTITASFKNGQVIQVGGENVTVAMGVPTSLLQ